MFYKSISEVYDYIFPSNIKQLELINSIRPIKKSERILDVGCATGNLSFLLYRKSYSVIGVDLDLSLLNRAIEKNKGIGVEFREADMKTLDKEFAPSSFDRVVSFGNTLVHLPDRESVKRYFNNVFSLLKDDGIFIVQIINYDRIIKRGIESLPTIDNSKITFKREYTLYSGFLDFNTELTIKENSQVIKNSIPLLTLGKEELIILLRKTGFREINFYGDLAMGELHLDSIPLIFSCKK